MDEGLHFLRILGTYTPMDVGNRMRWKLKPNGAFDIWLYYNKLRGSPSTVFLQKAIWRVKAPRRVSFFVWCVVWNKILTGDNLRLRRLDFVDWCIMCGHCGEMVDHLLFHCEMAYQLQSFVFITFALSWLYLDRYQTCFLAGGIGWGSIRLRFGTLFCCASYGVFGRIGIGGLLRTWMAPVIRCLFLLVKLFLIGFGLGNLCLVILFLFFFTPFLFCNYSAVWFSFMFFPCFLLLVSLGLLYVFHAQNRLQYIYHSNLSKRKKMQNLPSMFHQNSFQFFNFQVYSIKTFPSTFVICCG